MRTQPLIHNLPVEVVSRVFGCLDLGLLLLMAHVCSRWRTIAFNHPRYWSRVIVRNVNRGLLARSQHRIEQGGSRLMHWFEISYTQKHDLDDPVRKYLMPMLIAVVPRCRVLYIRIESVYRLHVEDALCQEAPELQSLSIFYESGPVPELHYWMPLGYKKQLLSNRTGRLRTVHLSNIVLPSIVTAAFEDVDEVWFMYAFSVTMDEFPCYLFEFFPKMTRLRLAIGQFGFTNAPLPRDFRNRFVRLAAVDIETKPAHLAACFENLPLHDMADVTVASADEDGIYTVLEPLQSWFDLILAETSELEFVITVKSRQTPRVRRFATPYRHYYPGSEQRNFLLENAEFAEQLATFHIQVSIWSRIKPYMVQSMNLLPKLILELNEDTLCTVTFPPEPLPCPNLKTLVIQAKHDLAYVDAEGLVAFADRLTAEPVTLELRRVFIIGDSGLVDSRFSSVVYSIVRYPSE